MIMILVLSVLACVMVVYFILTVTPNREVPALFIKRAHAQIRAGDLRGAYQMCEGRDELIAQVLRAGLKMHGHDRYVIQEAMESEGERGATALWQKISYLNNIGVIAPLLGLLGTVWGMIGAFGAIAYNDSETKSLVMAYNVAQAMITTAAGLMLAIPAMLVYYYLRGRVVKIVAEVEAQATEFVELLSGGPGR
ncbi:MAG: MotA/TolQ/ExbB proton channel family protein [Candidatus Hydrogenedentes bacterium]|nr:MotA/TolQ/ExbB proton channel family protein [Candidatus Hydrogenedentota bacterium]